MSWWNSVVTDIEDVYGKVSQDVKYYYDEASAACANLPSAIDNIIHGINDLANRAAVELLNSIFPAIVRGEYKAIKMGGYAILEVPVQAMNLGLRFALLDEKIIAGRVEQKIVEGIEMVKQNNNYMQGVNSIVSE